MITGDIKNQIDRIWDAFWSGGISKRLNCYPRSFLRFLRTMQ